MCPPYWAPSYTLILNVNPWLDMVCKSSSNANLRLVGLCLKLAALIDFRAPGIVAAVVPTPCVTFAVIVVMIPTAATGRKEQNNIGN